MNAALFAGKPSRHHVTVVVRSGVESLELGAHLARGATASW